MLYLFINFLVVTISNDRKNIYDAFDWYEDTGEAFGYTLACMCLLAGVFALLWVVSQKWKLPSYKARVNNKFDDLRTLGSTASAV